MAHQPVTLKLEWSHGRVQGVTPSGKTGEVTESILHPITGKISALIHNDWPISTLQFTVVLMVKVLIAPGKSIPM